jgi:hypothetical protein
MLAWPLFAFGPRIDYSDDELLDYGMTHPRVNGGAVWRRSRSNFEFANRIIYWCYGLKRQMAVM